MNAVENEMKEGYEEGNASSLFQVLVKDAIVIWRLIREPHKKTQKYNLEMVRGISCMIAEKWYIKMGFVTTNLGQECLEKVVIAIRKTYYCAFEWNGYKRGSFRKAMSLVNPVTACIAFKDERNKTLWITRDMMGEELLGTKMH